MTGDFTQNSGALEIELGGTERGVDYDSLRANGDIRLGGTLQVSLVGGFEPDGHQSFSILDWTGSLIGGFSSIALPELASHLAWDTSNLYAGGVLSVIFTELPGDFNSDESNDAADYVAWRKTDNQFDAWRASFGEAGASGDLNHDNVVNAADYVIWRKSNGNPDKYFGELMMGDPQEVGDFNGDGHIDTADYVIWRKNGGWSRDYMVWRELFGEANNGSGQFGEFAVPEPSGFFLLASSALLILLPVRQRGLERAIIGSSR